MVSDRSTSNEYKTFEETSKLAGEIEELGEFLRDDVSKLILAALTISPGPVGGEKLFRMVKEALETMKHKGKSVNDISRASFYRRLKTLVGTG